LASPHCWYSGHHAAARQVAKETLPDTLLTPLWVVFLLLLLLQKKIKK
jgi:hypothetical protein